MGGGYPAATKRLIQRSEGICQTIVNDKVIHEDGKLTGEMAGRVFAPQHIRDSSELSVNGALNSWRAAGLVKDRWNCTEASFSSILGLNLVFLIDEPVAFRCKSHFSFTSIRW